MKNTILLLSIILVSGLLLTGCINKEEKAKQDAINAIEKDNSLTTGEKEVAKNVVQNINTDDAKKDTGYCRPGSGLLPRRAAPGFVARSHQLGARESARRGAGGAGLEHVRAAVRREHRRTGPSG